MILQSWNIKSTNKTSTFKNTQSLIKIWETTKPQQSSKFIAMQCVICCLFALVAPRPSQANVVTRSSMSNRALLTINIEPSLYTHRVDCFPSSARRIHRLFGTHRLNSTETLSHDLIRKSRNLCRSHELTSQVSHSRLTTVDSVAPVTLPGTTFRVKPCAQWSLCYSLTKCIIFVDFTGWVYWLSWRPLSPQKS